MSEGKSELMGVNAMVWRRNESMLVRARGSV